MGLLDKYDAISRIYRSVPLEDSSFRVLEIHPSADIEAEIVCTLRRIEIDQEKGSSITYEALSYTWNPIAEEQTIILHSTPYRVGRNCFEALKRIRWTAGVRRVFVDAICINQKDDQEVNNQVAFMGQVYSHADRVLAWLGEIESSTPDHIGIAFRDMRRLYTFRRLFGNYEKSRVARAVRKALFRWESPIHLFIGGWHVYNWLDFIDTPYFDRLWPLQETALARRCILIAGEHKVPMEIADYVKSFMAPYGDTLYTRQFSKPHFIRRSQGFSAHRTLKEAVDARHNSALNNRDEIWHELRGAFNDVRQRIATHPYDKLYGFYGILQVLCDIKLPEPDRSLPLPILWTLGSQAVIQGFRSLDILCDVVNDDICRHHRMGVQCSGKCQQEYLIGRHLQDARWTYIWDAVPDAHLISWHRPLDFEEQRPPRNTRWDTEPMFFSKQEGIVPLGTTLTTKSSLLVRGVRLDSIKSRSNSPEYITRLFGKNDISTINDSVDGKGDFFAQVTCALHDWAAMIQTTGESWMELFYEIVTWGRTPVDLFGPAYVDFDPREQFQVWWDCLTRPLSPDTENLASLSKGIEERLRELKRWHNGHYHLQLCLAVVHRCLFLTEGGLIGNTWYTAREGDLVVLLCWSRMPAILRPLHKSKFAASVSSGEPEQYLLIGFAYVRGLMDCGKWNMPEDELEDFILI